MIELKFSYLSKFNSSRCVRSQAMYSSAASVILGHHDKSRLTWSMIGEKSLLIFYCLKSHQFSKILCYQLNPIIRHFTASRQRQNGKIWQRMNWNIFHDYDVKYFLNWPILTRPWFVISQQLCSLNTFIVPVCFGEKYERAESVTW